MLDAYFAAACVGLLIALAILSQAYGRLRKIADGRKLMLDELMMELEAADQVRFELRARLHQASKNDHRDAQGRFTKA